jgi:hypothetical protein
VAVPAADRARLEQLCRYLLRPAVARDRLLADGRVVLTLKSAWTDGARQLLFEPLTLLEKLAALIPRPRINLVLYHGVLAPHCGWRARVVAYGGRLRLIATVEDPEAIGAILAAASREEAGRAPPAAATQTLNRAAAPGA